ncbi:hypothetical protein ACP8Y2_14130 [Herpetosiphon llansteffanensis]
MLEPPINPQQRASIDSPQGYHVPIARLTNLNQPNRWKRWVGMNVFACFAASIIGNCRRKNSTPRRVAI